MPLVTFPMTALEPIQTGQKTGTIRFDSRLKTAKAGDTLTMQFGARNNPTTTRVTLTDVRELPVLDWLRSLAAFDARFLLDNVSLHDELRTGTAFERKLVNACKASGCNVRDVIEDCQDLKRDPVCLLW